MLCNLKNDILMMSTLIDRLVSAMKIGGHLEQMLEKIRSPGLSNLRSKP
jgi:hypothetical protein